MISLHRLGQPTKTLVLNCDLVLTVEANPDTVITLVTGARLIVDESPEQVVESIRRWRAEVGQRTFGVPKVVDKAFEYETEPDPTPDPSGLHTV
jgi:flagellar protein FlbD